MDFVVPADGWRPRWYQVPAWRYLQNTPYRARAILCHHRRAGKDHVAINWAAFSAFQRVGAYGHVFPYANQGRKIIWEGRDRDGRAFLDAFPEKLVEKTSERDMKKFLKNGSSYQVLGADDPDRLVGTNFIGIILSEFALMDPSVLRLLMPVLNENMGWLIIPSTPRGRNHYYRLIQRAMGMENWFVSLLSSKDTGAISEEQIDEDRRLGIPEDIIEQEYYVSFGVSTEGPYYAKQMDLLRANGRIGRVQWEPALPVHTAWDIGVDDCNAIWFYQKIRNEYRILEYLEDSGEGLGYYVNEIKKRESEKGWVFEDHHPPHDIKVKEYGSGKTRFETARDLGVRFREPTEKRSVQDGIEAVRQLLPKCWFDEEGCKRGLECLENYKKEWDSKKMTFKNKPLHDWASHGADAFRTLGMAESKKLLDNMDRFRDKQDGRDRYIISDYDELAT